VLHFVFLFTTIVIYKIESVNAQVYTHVSNQKHM